MSTNTRISSVQGPVGVLVIPAARIGSGVSARGGEPPREGREVRTMLAYEFLDGTRSRFTGFAWPPPGRPGPWHNGPASEIAGRRRSGAEGVGFEPTRSANS